MRLATSSLEHVDARTRERVGVAELRRRGSDGLEVTRGERRRAARRARPCRRSRPSRPTGRRGPRSRGRRSRTPRDPSPGRPARRCAPARTMPRNAIGQSGWLCAERTTRSPFFTPSAARRAATAFERVCTSRKVVRAMPSSSRRPKATACSWRSAIWSTSEERVACAFSGASSFLYFSSIHGRTRFSMAGMCWFIQ